MKIAVCSDLHLEFGTVNLENTENADVLILGGDICVAADLNMKDEYAIDSSSNRSERLHEFFDRCCGRFSHVIYTTGNHEHYHGNFSNTYRVLLDRLGYLRNLHILDKETFVLDDITFIVGTLWTDMNKEDPITLMQMPKVMNDFRYVKNGEVMFTPRDAVADHKKMLDCIKTTIEGRVDEKFVVVGHHAPSRMSTHSVYAKEVIMNGGYSSDLNDLILSNPQIKLWTHGHTHHEFDYMIGDCRVVCNPRGYKNYEDRADNFELKFVEV
jgi:hypothetical protein